jgi:hypothetical protein
MGKKIYSILKTFYNTKHIIFKYIYKKAQYYKVESGENKAQLYYVTKKKLNIPPHIITLVVKGNFKNFS